jgi:CheY-like chemotaxis protein
MRRTLLALTPSAKLRAALQPLRRTGVRVLEARTGIAALWLCASRPVDLAVLNFEEPGMDWPKLVEKLSSAFPGLPVVAMTERDEPADVTDRIHEALAAAPRKQPLAQCTSAGAAQQRRA